MTDFLQILFSGITSGSIYALVALGFALIYNASEVINFAQGDFVMAGGMGTVFLMAAGLPLPLAAAVAIAATVVIGLLLHRLAIEPARGASPVALIMITIGASIFLKGVAQIVFDKQFHSLPAFSGDKPIVLAGATILPQSLWVTGGGAVLFVLLFLFLGRSLHGKALRAVSANRLAARLSGVNVSVILGLAFGLSAAVGAIGGVLATPVTLTRFDAGTLFTLKGFAAAMLGGMGHPGGALVGGILIGLLEAFAAGWISSAYKDSIAFAAILGVLFFMPRGLFGASTVERV
jgi:branched-chain amino acid transport system permease protein